MFKDIKLSKELHEEYVNSQREKLEPQIDSVSILTDCIWPIKKSQSPSCILPSPLLGLVTQFKRFYESRH